MEIIFIEGNIGSGKTTFLEKLKKDNYIENVCYITEDVENWNYLSKFYKNPKEFCYELQIEIIYSKLNQIKNNLNNNQILVIERSFLTCFLFSLNSFFDGNLNIKQLTNLYDLCLKNIMDINKLFKKISYLYINTTPVICMQRIILRNRECEKNIKIEYIKKIDVLHNLFYGNINTTSELGKKIIDINKEFFN
jgi:deoxyadenosine/deoxycytidine kinase